MSPVSYPELVAVYPAYSDSPVASLRPVIKLYWSTDMIVTQFSLAGNLPNLVLLLKDDTGEPVELEYVDYEADDRLVLLQPTEDLLTGTTYRIIIKQGIESTFKRRHRFDRITKFDTAGSPINPPTLLAPALYGAYSNFPTITWVDQGYTYLIQIDDQPSFESPIESITLVGDSYTPSYPYPTSSSYYVRVKAVSGSASGDWSAITPFYYGTEQSAHPTTSTRPIKGFSVDWYATDRTNLGTWPSMIFDLSASVNNAATGYIEVTKQKVLPRNDVTGDYVKSSVPGSWVISSTTIEFIPTDDIEENTVYTIEFLRGFGSTTDTLKKSVTYYFSGMYSPYYTTLNAVKAMLGREAQMHPDDLINWMIHATSLEANARYASVILGPIAVFGPEGIDENTVRAQMLKSHAVVRWVAAATTYTILTRTLNDEIRNIGRTVALSDYRESLTADFLDAIKDAKQAAKEEMEKWEAEIIGTYDITMPSKSSEWSANYWYYDSFVWNAVRRKEL